MDTFKTEIRSTPTLYVSIDRAQFLLSEILNLVEDLEDTYSGGDYIQGCGDELYQVLYKRGIVSHIGQSIQSGIRCINEKKRKEFYEKLLRTQKKSEAPYKKIFDIGFKAIGYVFTKPKKIGNYTYVNFDGWRSPEYLMVFKQNGLLLVKRPTQGDSFSCALSEMPNDGLWKRVEDIKCSK